MKKVKNICFLVLTAAALLWSASSFEKKEMQSSGSRDSSTEVQEDEDRRRLIEFRKRQLEAREYILNETYPRIRTAFAFAQAGIPFNVENVLLQPLKHMKDERDPDMTIMRVLRILFVTDEYTEVILPYLKEIPLWFDKGDIQRVYWSENHMIMWTSSQFLLEQKFPNESFISIDSNVRDRLLWWLHSKLEVGFYEFYSHVYMRFTIGSLLNLYDFSEDVLVKSLAEKVILLFFDNLAQCLNEEGFCIAASGRDLLQNFVRNEMIKSVEKRLSYIFLGLGRDISGIRGDKDYTEFAIGALAHSNINLVPVMFKYSSSSYIRRRIGHGYKRGLSLRKNLTNFRDRTISQMTIGAYAHPDYVTDTLELLDMYSVWPHPLFSSYSFAAKVPKFAWKPLTKIASSVTKASVLDVRKLTIWKENGSVLSSIEDYFPGYKGYQQIPWVAGVGNTAVLTMSADSSAITDFFSVDNNHMNNQLPSVKQNRNLALIMYNPNSDLHFLTVSHLEVLFVFDRKGYVRIVEDGNWIFGWNRDDYIAIYRHCISDPIANQEIFHVCYDEQQTWVAFSGNRQTYSNFSRFQDVVRAGSIETTFGQICTAASVKIDGKTLENEFCRNLGDVNKLIIVLSFTLPLLLLGCFMCCRKQKACRKVCFNKLKELKQKTNKDETQCDDSLYISL